jgi:hypothetical protein
VKTYTLSILIKFSIPSWNSLSITLAVLLKIFLTYLVGVYLLQTVLINNQFQNLMVS